MTDMNIEKIKSYEVTEVPSNPNFDPQTVLKPEDQWLKELGYKSLKDFILAADNFSIQAVSEGTNQAICALMESKMNMKVETTDNGNGTFTHTFR